MHLFALSMLRCNRDRDLGPAITSPYVLGDEKAPPPHVRTSKWLEMAAGHQRKLVPIRQVRSWNASCQGPDLKLLRCLHCD